MSVKAAFIVVIGTVIGTQALAEDSPRPSFSDPAIYLQSETQRILLEADRISREATRWRAETNRLWRAESDRLLSEATKMREKEGGFSMPLGAVPAHRFPAPVPDERKKHYVPDEREKHLLEALERRRIESDRLDGEVKKLLKLAQDVDPRAQKDLLDRIRRCCQSTATDLLRQEIIRIAQSLGSDYSPSKP